jgi:hypothetical protein
LSHYHSRESCQLAILWFLKKVGIGEQTMPPVSNTVKNHPLSAWINPPSPVPAATRRGAEAAQSAAMYENDVSFSTRAKTSLPHCGEVSVPD